MFKYGISSQKVVLFVTWAMLFLTLSYAIAYTLISYDTLVNWYYNITPHFYKNDIWTSEFLHIGQKCLVTYTAGRWYSCQYLFYWLSYALKETIFLL